MSSFPLNTQHHDELLAAEAALAEKTATLDAIFRTIVDGIITIDSRGVIRSLNPAAERIFGYVAHELIGVNVTILMPEPHRSRHGEYLMRYLTTGERKIIGIGRELEGVRKDGSRFPMELAVSEMVVAGERMFTGVTRDITERKKAELAISKKNEELEAAARTDRIGAQVLLAFSRYDHGERPEVEILRILADQRNYRPLAFYEYDEWKGGLTRVASLSMLESASDATYRLGEGLIGEAALRRVPVFLDAVEHSPFCLDTGMGMLRAASMFILPLVYGDVLLGVIAGASASALTERERTWLPQVAAQISVGLRSLRQLTELKELSALLNDRSQRIELQNQELARASKLKSQFLASMSHELRTPLNAIIGFSEVLKDGLLGELPPEQNDYVAEIFQAGRHLLSLINDILDLSKIEAGKTELEVESVDLSSVVSNSLTIMKERAERGGVTLTQTIAPDVVPIEADGRKVRQIVYNLLSNAVKFTNKGGCASVEVKNVDQSVEVVVRDTGIGISPRDLERLFHAFEQLDSGLDRKYEGSGLGLALVKELVSLHHGSIGVESEVGKGTCFRVRLPLCQRQAANELADDQWAASKDRIAPRGALDVAPVSIPGDSVRRRVLVVDDEPNARDLIRLHLESSGFTVITANSGAAALERIAEHRPDIITLDINMPEGSGLAFLSAHAEVLKGIPVLVVSSADSPERAIAFGAHGVLPKPIRRAEFLDGIRNILGMVSGHRPYVLVCDDDPKAVRVVSSYLAQEEIEVGSCYGGKAALASIEARRPDLLILDLMMPELSGFDVLAELSSNAQTADIPVVILSAKELSVAERNTLLRNAQAVLQKASTARADLLAQVRRFINNTPNIGSQQ